MNILVYVDHPLAVAIASKLLGVLQSRSEGRQAGASFNFLVAVAAVPIITHLGRLKSHPPEA